LDGLILSNLFSPFFFFFVVGALGRTLLLGCDFQPLDLAAPLILGVHLLYGFKPCMFVCPKKYLMPKDIFLGAKLGMKRDTLFDFFFLNVFLNNLILFFFSIF
jgi:hypothetical protein